MQVQLRQWLAVGGKRHGAKARRGPAGGHPAARRYRRGRVDDFRNWLYQQKGKTFAIWQFNDRVPLPSTRLRVFFGDGVAISGALAPGCACAVSSSPVSDEPLWASRKFDS